MARLPASVILVTLSFPPVVSSKDRKTTKACELFVQKTPETRKRKEPTCHFMASWECVPGGEMGDVSGAGRR